MSDGTFRPVGEDEVKIFLLSKCGFGKCLVVSLRHPARATSASVQYPTEDFHHGPGSKYSCFQNFASCTSLSQAAREHGGELAPLIEEVLRYRSYVDPQQPNNNPQAIDEHVDTRRKRRREEAQVEAMKKERQERPKISDQFADLKVCVRVCMCACVLVRVRRITDVRHAAESVTSRTTLAAGEILRGRPICVSTEARIWKSCFFKSARRRDDRL